MISVEGFKDLDIVHQSSETLVFTAIRSYDNTKVTLKCLRPEAATVQQIALYKQEYDLTHPLLSKQWIL